MCCLFQGLREEGNKSFNVVSRLLFITPVDCSLLLKWQRSSVGLSAELVIVRLFIQCPNWALRRCVLEIVT